MDGSICFDRNRVCLLHAVQRSQNHRFETSSFYFLMAASALVFLGNVGVLINQAVLATFGFPWGAILWMLGLGVFGIATLMAKTLPLYVGISIILLEPGSLLTGLALSPIAPLYDRGAYSAGIEKGLVLALVALGMKRLAQKETQE
jgi:FtsH-binding integral membrane protein